ncbi:DUF1642 domain-containing protein [Lactococcus garvieae]|uniref:DUF1642 domain-containing protein n=1 Tax=Lactococcus garvieae TaxID=1363 RepID=UPI0030CAAA37
MVSKDIKPVATPKSIRDEHGVHVFREPTAVYTADKMQDHAEAKCWELINWYVESTGDVKHAAEMKIWMDDEFKEKKMKKFEEEVRKNDGGCFAVFKNGKTTYEIQGLTGSPLMIFGDWVSPEDHQNTVASNKAYEKSNLVLSEENAKFVVENIELEKQIIELKSQLEKQQPEIPEFVAKFIKYTAEPIYEICAWAEHYGDNGSKCDDPDLAKTLDWFGMNRNLFYKAVINGYTVAKEKRFYLKNKLTGLYLYENDNEFSECEEGSVRWAMFKTEFTQQEIDSMETGSYEQIEVEE